MRRTHLRVVRIFRPRIDVLRVRNQLAAIQPCASGTLDHLTIRIEVHLRREQMIVFGCDVDHLRADRSGVRVRTDAFENRG